MCGIMAVPVLLPNVDLQTSTVVPPSKIRGTRCDWVSKADRSDVFNKQNMEFRPTARSVRWSWHVV